MPFRQTFAQLFAQDTTIAEVVFGLVAATLIVAFALSWHRRRTGRRPSRKSTANRVELTYLTALTGMAAFLVVASLTANTKESTDPKPADARAGDRIPVVLALSLRRPAGHRDGPVPGRPRSHARAAHR